MNAIDLHTHGLRGLDTRINDETAILEFASLQFVKGVAGFLPTIYPAPVDVMRSQLYAVRKAMQAQVQVGSTPTGQARILGAHMEGPFLNPLHAGALDPSCFAEAKERTLDALINGFEDVVRIVTLAPEMAGILRLIERLSSQGIVVSMGHSNATFAQAEDGYRAGARGITHLFNAMRGIHHREPGIAGFGLLNDDIYVEVIADGYHLHQRTIEMIFRVKNHSRILIVSDSVAGTQLSLDTGAVTDQEGRLQGGGLTVTESAELLIAKGIAREVVTDCISLNPDRYLESSQKAKPLD